MPTSHSHSRPSPSNSDAGDKARQKSTDARPPDEVWLSSRDVSERLQIPLKTLASWASSGRGPRYARMGRYRRYRLVDLQVWEHEQLDRTSNQHD